MQQHVAHRVTERVVHQLESVQVNEHQGQLRTIPLGLQHRQVQAVPKQHPVGQVGQDVVVSLIGNELVSFHAVSDVAGHPIGAMQLKPVSCDHAGRLLFAVGYRHQFDVEAARLAVRVVRFQP